MRIPFAQNARDGPSAPFLSGAVQMRQTLPKGNLFSGKRMPAQTQDESIAFILSLCGVYGGSNATLAHARNGHSAEASPPNCCARTTPILRRISYRRRSHRGALQRAGPASHGVNAQNGHVQNGHTDLLRLALMADHVGYQNKGKTMFLAHRAASLNRLFAERLPKVERNWMTICNPDQMA